MDKLESILERYQSVSLEEISGVKLMKRVDRKFWFHSSLLEYLLEQLLFLYDILEVNGKRLIKYQTVYFDTGDNQMYLHHHNGFRDRYKVRRRKYETSEFGFFEIKKKTNKQRTIKKRIETSFHDGALSNEEQAFLLDNSPCCNVKSSALQYNRFKRITLVNKKKNERCTIDFQLEIGNNHNKASLDSLVILELKRENMLGNSPLISILKELRIRQKGLSKYCTGRALFEPGLKSNKFKPHLLYLQNNIMKNQLHQFSC